MADDPGRAGASSNGDLELLESGNFADVEVICGDRTWKCHRAILVPRSVWFKKALSGPFQACESEATTRQIKLDEENPVCVDLALKYIYGRGLDLQSSISSEHFVEHCVSLWHLADFLLLGPLKSPLEKAVHDYCDKRMKQFCTLPCRSTWDDKGKLSPWAVDLLSGVRESYKRDTEHLKAVLMEFIWVGRFWTLEDDTDSATLNYLKDTWKFVSDLLGHYASSAWINGAVWAPPPRSDTRIARERSKCRGCKAMLCWNKPTDTTGRILDPFELNRFCMLSTGWCRDCSKPDTIPWRTSAAM